MDGERSHPSPLIGCAGWALDRNIQSLFPAPGTHLERYASVFPAVEINSSFYRPHKPETYRRWAASVPERFRFSVKIPKEITHAHRLRDFHDPLQRFLSEVSGLGAKLGPLLVQLPPSLAFHPETAVRFFQGMRISFPGLVAVEPRHASWFTPAVEGELERYRIARVAADPAVRPGAAMPGGWDGFVYHRLHGSPKMYHSAYPENCLDRLAEKLAAEAGSRTCYCIFDNTALGEAIPNALSLMAKAGIPAPGLIRA